MTQSVKARVSLNLPASLKAAAERYAERDGVSLNQFISVALGVSQQENEKFHEIFDSALF